MKSTEILNKIKTYLIEDKVEEIKEETQLEVQEEIKEEVKVELAQAKLENGTVVESESFKAGDEIFIITDDEKVAMPVGEYVMEDGKLLVVEEEGLIADYREVSDDALLVGRMVHDYCEAAINWKLGRGEAPGMPDNEAAESSINAFRAWVRENDVEFISSEEKVYSREHNYAGTIDAVANVNGEFSVVDFKTSARIYNTYYIQCAAYAQCVKEVYDKEIDMSYILRFDKKTGAFEVGKAVETAENFRAFRGFQEGYLRLTEMDNRSKRK